LTTGCIHDTAAVVKPVVKRVWQLVECLQTRYNRLSNRLYNRFDNRLYRVNKHTNGYQTNSTVRSTGCQTGLYNRFDNRLYHVNGA